MSLKRNLVANYFGQGWGALMGLAFIPQYIKYLGIEAYGLIGLFAILQVWLSLLDMGMTPTLGREMARFTGGEHSNESIRDLLRTIEIIAVGIAFLVAGGVALSSHWIASAWLKAEALPVELVAQAFSIMGLVTALRFLEGVYRSAIVGLQRQVLFNVVHSVMATLRGFGAVVILAGVSATIEAFFIWQGIVSISTLGILLIATYGSLPRGDRSGRFSTKTLRDVWRFAGGMLGITFLAMLLTQVDKILLSKLLPLSEFGYYTLAATVAGVIPVLIGPIIQAFYPRLCELHARNDEIALADTYHKGSQLVSVTAGSLAVVLVLFSEIFLYLWTQDADLASRVAPLLSLLALGNLLNGLMWMPYQTQLAYGWTSLTMRINIVAVSVIVPSIFWTVPKYGAVGAAWVWVVLNIGYIFLAVHLMYRRILPSEKLYWYQQDLLMPLLGALIPVVLIKIVMPVSENTFVQAMAISMAIGTALLASTIAADQLREQALSFMQALIAKLLPNQRL